MLAMLVELAMSPQAQAQEQPPAILKWTEVDTPGAKGNVIVTPSEVSRIAAGRGDILYAIDSENNKVYRSDNGGLTWTDITRGLPPDELPASEIAVAPDRPQNVAVVTDGGTKVYVSTNSGATWSDTNVPPLAAWATIQCIAISKTYLMGTDTMWDIAIGTAFWGDGTTVGQVWILSAGGLAGAWQDTNINIVPGSGAEVSAVAFSPNYAIDGTTLAVASTDTDVSPPPGKTWLCAGQRDFSAQTTVWNSNSPYFPGYPVEIVGLSGDELGVDRIVSSIVLPSDYRGNTDQASRKVLVSCDRQPIGKIDNSDVYRVDDTTQNFSLKAGGGAAIDIRNIAYYGTLASGKLIAGDVNHESTSLYTTQVRRLSDPFSPSATPATSWGWRLASQPPSGPGNAQVAWSYQGRMAFCGTGATGGAPLDESAFSRSVDDGDTWEQASLIDTVINISDIVPAPDSKSLFLATYSAFGVEGVWRSAGEPLGNFWGRVLTMNTSSDRIILRLSPDYITDYTIYVAEVSDNSTSSLMAVSHNRGNSWQKPYGPKQIIDMAVENRDTVYVALPGGYIRKSVNSGFRWLGPTATDLSEINMLSVVGEGAIFVGSRDSRVAYSTDNGSSFTEIDKPISYHTGDVQVVADANYDKNKLIYAADNVSDDGIWRWSIGLSAEWEQIDESVTRLGAGQPICGLGMGNEGTLYALWSDNATASGGGMDRSLNPSLSYVYDIEFDIVNATLPAGTRFDPLLIFPNTLPHLKLSWGAAQNELWAVGTTNNTIAIYRFQDNLCKVGPVTTAPGEIGCDPVSGRAQEVNLCWEQLSLADAYDIEVAKDKDFSIRIIDWVPEDAVTGFLTPASVTSPCAYFPAGGAAAGGSELAVVGNLECGHTYYWRVRVRHAATTEVIRSPWSDVSSFTVKAGLPVRAEYYGPRLLSPDNDCLGCPVKTASFSWSPFKEITKYRFVLAKDASMTQVVAEATVATTAYEYGGTLEGSTSYFWRVMAIDPAPSDWSATFTFQTEPASPLPHPLAEPPATPLWVWVIIAIGIMLDAGLFILILRRQSIY